METTLPAIVTAVTNKLLGSYMWNADMSIEWSKLQGHKSCGHSLLKTCTSKQALNLCKILKSIRKQRQ